VCSSDLSTFGPTFLTFAFSSVHTVNLVNNHPNLVDFQWHIY
jgi:hypothetical protein